MKYIVTSRGAKNKIISKIDDDRLTPEMILSRSGSTQMFRVKIDNQFTSHKNADVILTPPKNSYYAEIIDNVWHWVEGCYECNGEKRDWMCYIECDEHNRCRVCEINREDLKEAPWGGKDGWICKPCEAKRKAIEKAEALAKMPEEHDPWDYEDNDSITCPYCNQEIYEDHGHYESDKEKETCSRCDGEFLVTANHSITFTTERS